MQIVLQSTGHAKSLAKSLCRSLAGDGRDLKLTAAQAAVARMFGYADYRALCAAAGKGDPDPYEDEMEAAAASARRQAFASRLAQALDVPPAKARSLVEAIGPLRRDWRGHDDWRTRRQAYFAVDPFAGEPSMTDFNLWTPGMGIPRSSPLDPWHAPGDLLLDEIPSLSADPDVYGPKAYTVDVAFGRQVEPKFVHDPKPDPEKAAHGIEYVYAKIAMGDAVLGWLRGVVVDLSTAATRLGLRRIAELLDGPLVAGAGELLERRMAKELDDDAIAGYQGKAFVVSTLIRNPKLTPKGAGAALLTEATEAVAARYGGPFRMVLNATPPQYRTAHAGWTTFPGMPDHPEKNDPAADETALRSTGRAAAARSLKEYLLRIPLPEEMADVEAYDLGVPYRCTVPHADPPGVAYGMVIDEPGSVFDFRDATAGERSFARSLFGDAPDPAVEALLVDQDTALAGFDFEEAWLLDRIVRPHPELWRRMPKALRRIEIERATEDMAWTIVRRELTDYDAPAQFRPALRPTKVDTIVFVFENGTRAEVPERQLATGDFRDVIGPAFADASGRSLRTNPYTDEMSIGDLWSMLTANAALLYSGGGPLAFRDGRIVLVRP